MQKHKLILLFSLFCLICFSFADIVSAGIISLPRYQGTYSERKQSGGKDKVTVTCASKGGVEKGANQTCSGAISGVNNCYTSCSCATGYKMSGGSCVLKTCSDYGYQANDDTTKSCETKTPRSGLTCYSCTSCNTSTYKYSCSGTGYASTQSGTSCNNLYAECSCSTNYRWSGGKCVCDGNYKADSNGTCSLKTCSDYGYAAEKDTTKSCETQTPRSGLTCYNCSACTGTLYDCSSISNNNGADTSSTSCGGKYAKCKCKTGYFWDNGSCEKSCTPVSCNGIKSCGNGHDCTMFGSVSEGVETYDTCEARNCDNEGHQNGYRATSCKTDKESWTLASGICFCTADANGYQYTAADCKKTHASCSNLGCNDKYKTLTCSVGTWNGSACEEAAIQCPTVSYPTTLVKVHSPYTENGQVIYSASVITQEECEAIIPDPKINTAEKGYGYTLDVKTVSGKPCYGCVPRTCATGFKPMTDLIAEGCSNRSGNYTQTGDDYCQECLDSGSSGGDADPVTKTTYSYCNDFYDTSVSGPAQRITASNCNSYTEFNAAFQTDLLKVYSDHNGGYSEENSGGRCHILETTDKTAYFYARERVYGCGYTCDLNRAYNRDTNESVYVDNGYFTRTPATAGSYIAHYSCWK